MKQIQLTYLVKTLSLGEKNIKSTISLLDEGATVPFISRYRKEQTGSLDEVQIGEIKQHWEKLKEADKRRIAIIGSIEEQGKMTPTLLKSLENALLISDLEDLYLPYKQKRKTRASIAIENGLEPFAKLIFAQSERNIDQLAQKYLNSNVLKIEDAFAGARDIIAEWINDDLEARNRIRNLFENTAIINSSIKKGKNENAAKYQDYFDFSEELRKIPSHRLLAIRRAEQEELLKVTISVNFEKCQDILERQYLRGLPEPKEQVKIAIADSLKRLLLPSVETEFNNTSKDKADVSAIQIFSNNLRQLLLSPPLGQKRVLAIDPGFRTGCKTVVLNEIGDLKYDTVIFPTDKKSEATIIIKDLIAKYNIEAIAIGNGTAGRETEAFIKSLIQDTKLANSNTVYAVSEQGASIYSASTAAREEFPNKDVTVRGAISIGRRLKDPLAELVKIDPKSIGVGQYQHDVDQKMLKNSLDVVVESCVNKVGVELNTASKHLLSYVSGLGPVLAQNIINYRNENGIFKSRSELKKVARLGDKAFEQSAGFLRIHGAKNPLDNSGVHPERYELVNLIAKDCKVSVQELIDNDSIRKSIDLKKYCNEFIGMPTLKDIMDELDKPGRDPREQLESFEFGNVHKIEDLSVGMTLPGIVTNITAFGCFVDVGVHQDGLLHISNMVNRFIKDPNEVVTVHQKVKVKVIELDIPRKRIGLSMKEVL
jgi:protein Tex